MIIQYSVFITKTPGVYSSEPAVATGVASQADILLARHAIFPPQRTSSETSGAFLSHCVKISRGDHAEST